MTTLQSILDDRFTLIDQKEALIRQLQDEIAQHRVFLQAAEGVSSTLDSAKELFYNAMHSFYSLMQHEPEHVRQQATEKIWDDFEQLDTRAREHVANRRALVSETVSEGGFDNNLSESETNLSEFDGNLSDNLSLRDAARTESGTHTTLEAVAVSDSGSDVGASPLDSETVFERNPSDSEEIVSDSLRTVVEHPSNTLSDSSRTLTADELSKDQVNWQALKALAVSKGVTAKKRPQIEAALLELGVTDKDLWEVRLEF